MFYGLFNISFFNGKDVHLCTENQKNGAFYVIPTYD